MYLVNELDLCFESWVMCVKFEVNWGCIAAVRDPTEKHHLIPLYTKPRISNVISAPDRHRQLQGEALRSSQ